METTRVKYTINPKKKKKIEVGTLTWKRLVVKYYIMDEAFTDQIISDSLSLKVKDNKEKKVRKACKRVDNPAGMKGYIIVGNKT